MSDILSQGDIIKIENVSELVLVVSKDFFNQSQEIIGCPILMRDSSSPVHHRIEVDDIKGYVHCEKLKLFDMNVRRFKHISRVPMPDVIEISDIVQGLFDYI